MNYYVGAIQCSSELYHHGIKGQKWGVRRFQNEDGSLTSAGKGRYRKGREVSREYISIRDKERERLQKSSKKYREAEKEVERLKTQVDYAWDEDERRRTEDRRWNKEEDMRVMNDEFNKKAEEYARKQILEKRGDVALSDMDHYHNVNTAIATTTAILAAVGIVAISSRRN